MAVGEFQRALFYMHPEISPNIVNILSDQREHRIEATILKTVITNQEAALRSSH